MSPRMPPGAGRTSEEGPLAEIALRIKVAVPPANGKANAEAAHFLARWFGVSGCRVTAVEGVTGRDELVLARGAEHGEWRGKLSALSG